MAECEMEGTELRFVSRSCRKSGFAISFAKKLGFAILQVELFYNPVSHISAARRQTVGSLFLSYWSCTLYTVDNTSSSSNCLETIVT